ncbi:hypothetical protein TrST_g3123 [Triparma strigata]|uniref:Uncharacterized protein n=1 Tax=Triparma strigata TaxID=1606541 RepID=A0A9W7C6S6_9STRA|nr:hypothetical protein TrST_g3123 [Triparma strigata]
MTNATCDYFLRGTILDECSGHGVCVAEVPNEWVDNIGKCICEDGWTGSGDLMNGIGMDCHLKIDLLRNWWGVSSVAFLLQAAFSAWCCNNALAVQGKAFWSKSSNKAIMNATLFGILRSIDGALRFATGDDSGTSVVIAIFHAGAGWLFWGILSAQFCELFLVVVIAQAKMDKGDQADAMKARMEKMHTLIRNQKFIAFPAYIIVIIAAFDRNPEHHKIYSGVYYALHCALSYYLVSVIALPVANTFYKILVSAPEESRDDKMKALINKVFIFCRECKNAGHFNTLCTVSFLCFPFLWNCQSYQIVFAWMSAIPLLCIAAWITSPVKKSGKNKVGPSGVAQTTMTTTTTSSE